MTLAEMETSTKTYLTPAEVAPVLGVDPHSIRMQARSDPSKLGFPVIVTGTRTRIPRTQFLGFIGRERRPASGDKAELAEKWDKLMAALEEFAEAFARKEDEKYDVKRNDKGA